MQVGQRGSYQRERRDEFGVFRGNSHCHRAAEGVGDEMDGLADAARHLDDGAGKAVE